MNPRLLLAVLCVLAAPLGAGEILKCRIEGVTTFGADCQGLGEPVQLPDTTPSPADQAQAAQVAAERDAELRAWEQQRRDAHAEETAARLAKERAARAQLEQSLGEAEARIKELSESAPAPVWGGTYPYRSPPHQHWPQPPLAPRPPLTPTPEPRRIESGH